QPVKLKILARGDVGNVVAVVTGDLRHDAQLLCRHIAARNLDPQHKMAHVGLLLIDAVPAHSREVVRRDGVVPLLRVPQNIRPDIQAVFLFFDRLYIGFRHIALLPYFSPAPLSAMESGAGALLLSIRSLPQRGGTGQDCPTQSGAATAFQRLRIASNCAGDSGPAASSAAFSCQRPGFVVPTIAVCTPGRPRVNRSAIPTASLGESFRKS